MKQGLFITTVWPEPNSSAAGTRTLQILEAVAPLVQNWCVASPCKDSHYKNNIEKKGFTTQTIQANDSRFDEWIKALDPQIVLMDRFHMEEQFGWRIKENCPNALMVIDSQDLHCLRTARQAQLEPLSTETQTLVNLEKNLESHPIFLREAASFLRSDGVFLLSEVEVRILEKLGFSGQMMAYLPMWPTSLQTDFQMKMFGKRNHFAFIGNFRHPPNDDCIEVLHRLIWPKIRTRLPNTELHIYGAYPPKKWVDRHQPKNGFLIMGQAPDAIETLSKYRILLAPLRYGAGVKGKILDAWQAGTPVLTTSIGGETLLPENNPWGGQICDQVDLFINNAVELYCNEEQWTKFSAVGTELLKSFSPDLLKEKIRLTLTQWKSQREIRRQQNWLGRILESNASRSTKYFSKWIEEKGKHRSIAEHNNTSN